MKPDPSGNESYGRTGLTLPVQYFEITSVGGTDCHFAFILIEAPEQLATQP